MEFTYHGLVRCAYGFANPNHAAALITLLLPFLWALRVYFRRALLKYAVFGVESVLYVALISTYSRTGFFTALLSVACFWGGASIFSSIKLIKNRAGSNRFSPGLSESRRFYLSLLPRWSASKLRRVISPGLRSPINRCSTAS
ncbi:MAG: hypothetical protein PHH77_09565 [Victivallaceae bacterium]|nr:hypothetical protein [Victivallaceae bacterium]